MARNKALINYCAKLVKNGIITWDEIDVDLARDIKNTMIENEVSLLQEQPDFAE